MSVGPIERELGQYFTSIRSCENEPAKKELFLTTLTLLFPKHATELRHLATGAEKFVKYKITPSAHKTRGRIDSLYGNLVLEFEYDLNKTGDHAAVQLREYVAKLWSKEKEKSHYVCVASDGILWKIFTPRLETKNLRSNKIKADDVELIENESLDASKVSKHDFYAWLDRVFFRDNSIKPTGKMISTEFGITSYHFTSTFDDLFKIYKRSKSKKEVQVAFQNWQRYLRYTYGDVDGPEELFVAHSYMSAFVKILMAIVLATKKKESVELNDLSPILNGEFFHELNIRNYAEQDFFYWINFSDLAQPLRKIWARTFNLLRAYSFDAIDSDFLKDIYQGIVDPKDKHDLGEYYTDDWLCEKIVAEALISFKSTKNIPKIADITCGSGSFLRVAINSLKKKLGKGSGALASITKNVIGFEIHPLAAFIAKTNYMLALDDLIRKADRPVTIPIFLCDSLLNSELDKTDLFKRNRFAIRVAGKTFEFPLSEALTDERFDELVDYIDSITHAHKKRADLPGKRITALLERRLKQIKSLNHDDYNCLLDTLSKITELMHDKVISHENTIWSFVLKNNFRPILFTRAIDVVVGNPPWLSFRYIKSQEYRNELEELGLKKYEMAPKSGKLRTHMELATIFLAHAVDSYLKPSGTAHLVLPRSVFSADHHSKFRDQSYNLNMNLDEIWDLADVNPLFPVPSCVIHASHTPKKVKKAISGKVFSGRLNSKNLLWQEARDKLTILKNKKFHLVKMGDRTAFSAKKSSIKEGDNYYQKRFKQGATILPRNYYFVDVSEDEKKKRVVSIKTSVEIRKNSKKPYKEVNLLGRANKEFLFHTLLAENILPFAVVNPFVVHLPLEKKRTWKFLDSKGMAAKGFSDSSKWFSSVEQSFKKLCKTGMTMNETLDYFGKLLCQNPSSKYWVLYCAAGTNVCAAVYKNPGLLWVEHKNYWFCPKTREEAYYLVGVLNVELINELVKPFQTRGLFGERDIEKKVLDVGIPRFDPKNKTMKKISELSETLSSNVARNASQFTGKRIGMRRDQVRIKFKSEISEIERLVERLFARA